MRTSSRDGRDNERECKGRGIDHQQQLAHLTLTNSIFCMSQFSLILLSLLMYTTYYCYLNYGIRLFTLYFGHNSVLVFLPTLLGFEFFLSAFLPCDSLATSFNSLNLWELSGTLSSWPLLSSFRLKTDSWLWPEGLVLLLHLMWQTKECCDLGVASKLSSLCYSA